MKKYLLIILLIGQFGNAQYNLFARQNFAKSISAPTYNTYIGGVSATISTASALATKLGISVGAISNFTIVGSDIKCKITGSYGIPASAFTSDTNITNYIDSDGLVNQVGNDAFNGALSFDKIVLNGITSLGIGVGGGNIFRYCPLEVFEAPLLTNLNTYAIFNNTTNPISAYMPLLATIASSVSGNENVFLGIYPGTKLYVKPSLATVNAGGVEGDIAYSITQGATISYVSNFTAPSAISDLSAGTIYNTAIQLNFTPPSSTNTIDYYECYANGVFKNRITGSGQYITGLTASTNYDITIKAVDIFYNKSTSNVLNVSTNTTSAVPTTGLVSYYKLDSNANDSFGINNGTDTSVSYVAGKVNNAGSYNGTTSKTIIGNPSNVQLSSGTISCWIKASSAGASYRQIFGKNNAFNLFLKDGVLVGYNYGSFGGVGDRSTGVNLNDGRWHHLVYVFDSSVTNGSSIYIDGVLKLTFSMSVSSQTEVLCIGFNAGVQFINALIDEPNIYNTKLTQNEIDRIFNSGIGTTL